MTSINDVLDRMLALNHDQTEHSAKARGLQTPLLECKQAILKALTDANKTYAHHKNRYIVRYTKKSKPPMNNEFWQVAFTSFLKDISAEYPQACELSNHCADDLSIRFATHVARIQDQLSVNKEDVKITSSCPVQAILDV